MAGGSYRNRWVAGGHESIHWLERGLRVGQGFQFHVKFGCRTGRTE